MHDNPSPSPRPRLRTASKLHPLPHRSLTIPPTPSRRPHKLATPCDPRDSAPVAFARACPLRWRWTSPPEMTSCFTWGPRHDRKLIRKGCEQRQNPEPTHPHGPMFGSDARSVRAGDACTAARTLHRVFGTLQQCYPDLPSASASSDMITKSQARLSSALDAAISYRVLGVSRYY